MLKAIELENFKAFGQRTRIEFAPITLIFGENSAGKSSILQALNLLKQTRESREHGAILLPRAENGIVDLGSFQELIFDHDLQRDLTIRVDFEANLYQNRRFRDRNIQSLESDSYQGVEFRVARRSDDEEIELKELTLHTSEADGRIAVFEPFEPNEQERRKILRESLFMSRDRRIRRSSDLKLARCTWITDKLNLWLDHFNFARSKSREYTKFLQDMKIRMESAINSENQDEESELEIREQLAEITKAIEFYQSDFCFNDFIERMRRLERLFLIELDGFTPLPVRTREFGLAELDLARATSNRIRKSQMTIEVASLAHEIGRNLDFLLESLYPMGPYRRPPERWYIFTGTSPHDVGYRGDMLPDLLFRRPELVADTNKWLEKLQIGYRIAVRAVGERSRDLFEVRLFDSRRGKEVDVALSDVGFGISQILPFVVQSLAGKNQVITIEQPEVHIHPRLQADLGNLIAGSIVPPRNNRFIIETHSEHLVLRMQRLIREQTLRPSDVSVIYVSRSETGSIAKRLHIDDEGDFIDEWPGGFFPERLKELR